MIVESVLPDRATSREQSVDGMCRVPLETMHHTIERPIGQIGDKMQMIRHRDGTMQDNAALCIQPFETIQNQPCSI